MFRGNEPLFYNYHYSTKFAYFNIYFGTKANP